MTESAKISELTDRDRAVLAEMEAWVAGHYTEETRHIYEHFTCKLEMLQEILDNNSIEESDPHRELLWQRLGATLGTTLTQYYDRLAWKIIDDEFGRSFCLVYKDTTIRIFPIPMISKRLMAGEAVSIRRIFVATCEAIDKGRNEAV
ncbi:MAG: DUF3806 domain-containing protein [Pseudomonadota bacterium]